MTVRIRLAISGILALAALQAACGKEAPAAREASGGGDSFAGVGFVRAFSQLTFDRPVFLTQIPGSDDLVVLEQRGLVFRFARRDDVEKKTEILDIREIVYRGHNEEGLLGLAFHPEFERNRELFLHYSAKRPRRGVLARFSMDQDGHIDPASRQVLLEIPQPYGNHNGGSIEFGPDGYLYLGLGDGGAGGDPHGHGQNLGTLLGSILRLDIDSPPDRGFEYAIPADNPFVADPDARPEIWAYGLRNPWRFSFDRETGDLWVGDVGQNAWEEIDIVVRGGNYGWNPREGKHAFRRASGKGPFLEPVIDYDREDARSITGGYVYRGSVLADFQGAYVHGDYETGRVWALWYDGEKVTRHETLGRVSQLSSFGEDADGSIYALSLHPGQIFRLTEVPGP